MTKNSIKTRLKFGLSAGIMAIFSAIFITAPTFAAVDIGVQNVTVNIIDPNQTDPDEVFPGTDIIISQCGFTPGESVNVRLDKDQNVLVTVIADNNGCVTLNPWHVPDDITEGPHDMTFTGEISGHEEIYHFNIVKSHPNPPYVPDTGNFLTNILDTKINIAGHTINLFVGIFAILAAIASGFVVFTLTHEHIRKNGIRGTKVGNLFDWYKSKIKKYNKNEFIEVIDVDKIISRHKIEQRITQLAPTIGLPAVILGAVWVFFTGAYASTATLDLNVTYPNIVVNLVKGTGADVSDISNTVVTTNVATGYELSAKLNSAIDSNLSVDLINGTTTGLTTNYQTIYTNNSAATSDAQDFTVEINVNPNIPAGTYNASFTYQAVADDFPTVKSITPNIGLGDGVTPPAQVTIEGEGFLTPGFTAPTFDGVQCTNMTIIDATHLTCTPPAHNPGTVNVELSNDAGSEIINGGYTYEANPSSTTITSISPDHGTTAGGTLITITANNTVFDSHDLNTVITVGGNSCLPISFIPNSPTPTNVLTCETPAGVAGPADVVITNTVGSLTATGGFTYIEAPQISGISPASGPEVGGTTVIISGSSFTGTTGVTIGGNAISYTVDNDGQITIVVPAGTGSKPIVVTNTIGSSMPVNYTYIAAPTNISVTPKTYKKINGGIVEIDGDKLANATNINFNDGNGNSFTVNAPFDSNDASHIRVNLPTTAQVVSSYNVSVTTNGGTSALTTNEPVQLVDVPTITTVSPQVINDNIPRVLTVNGTNFVNGKTKIYIGNSTGYECVNVQLSNLEANGVTYATATCETAINMTIGGPQNITVSTFDGQDGYTATLTDELNVIHTPVNPPTVIDPTPVPPANGPYTCPSGFVYDSNDKKCHQEFTDPTGPQPTDCPTGYQYNSIKNTCEYDQIDVVEDPSPWPNEQCSTGYVYDANDQKCHAKKDVPIDPTDPTTSCPTGYQYDQVNGNCDYIIVNPGPIDPPVTNPPTCPTGWIYDTTLAKCVVDVQPPVTPPTTCSIGYQYNPVTGLCDYVNPGTNPVDPTPVPPNPGPYECPTGYVYNAADGKCWQETTGVTPPGSTTCQAGYQYNSVTGRCDLIRDPDPQPPVTPTQPGDICPTGYSIGTDGDCHPDFVPPTLPNDTCPTGYYYNQYSGRCELGTDPFPPTVNSSVQIISATPSEGPAVNSSTITFTGTNFMVNGISNIKNNQVTFGGVVYTVANLTATSFDITGPISHTAGFVDISFDTVYDETVYASDIYEFWDAPNAGNINAITDNYHKTNGKSLLTSQDSLAVTATASTFSPNTTLQITNGTNTYNCTVVVNDDENIDCQFPTGPMAAGNYSLQVTTAGGSVTVPGGAVIHIINVPTATNVSPNTSQLGSTQTITITGTNFIQNLTTVYIGINGMGNTALDQYLCQNVNVTSSTTLTCNVPTGIIAGGAQDIYVNTFDGLDSYVATITNGYDFTTPTGYLALSPNIGPTTGGTTVTVTGNMNLTGQSDITSVTVNGIAATSPTYIANNQLSFITPANPAGSYDVVVTVASGVYTENSAFTYYGTSMTNAKPTVTAVKDSTNTNTTNYLKANTDSQVITIIGTAFVTNITTFTFGGTATSPACTIISQTEARCIAPNKTAGKANIVATNTWSNPSTTGSSTSAGIRGTDMVEYLNAPTITAITSPSPAQGSISGGTTVTITTTGFRDSDNNPVVSLSSPVDITIGGSTVVTPSRVGSTDNYTFTTPAHAAGTVTISATNIVGQTGTSTATYTYVAEPHITSITENYGKAGDTVTINGSNFTGTTCANIKFGTTGATTCNVVSNTEITVEVPSGSGQVNVTVTNNSQVSPENITFNYIAAPTLTGPQYFKASTATAQTKTYAGTNLNPVQGTKSAKIAGAAVTIGTNTGSAIDLSVSVSRAAGAYNVEYTTAGGTATLTGGADYLATPTITGPAYVSTAGGVITITGANYYDHQSTPNGIIDSIVFNNGADTECVNPTVTSATTLTCTLPTMAAGNYTVTIGNKALDTNTATITVVDAPTITNVNRSDTPNNAYGTTGDSIEITGTGFATGYSNGTAVDCATQTTCQSLVNSLWIETTTGAGTAATQITSFTVTGPDKITFIAPGLATNLGLRGIKVVTPVGTYDATAGTVTNGVNGMTYVGGPTLTSVVTPNTPNTTVAGNATTTGVILNGSGFQSSGADLVKNWQIDNMTPITTHTTNSATQITVTIPAGLTLGTHTIKVTTFGGVTSTQQFIVSDQANGSLSPTTGDVAGGYTFTITEGANNSSICGITQVNWGDVVIPVAQLNVTNCASGTITGTVPSWLDATSSPQIISASPNVSDLAGGTTVTLTGVNFAAGQYIWFGDTAGEATPNNPRTVLATAPGTPANGDCWISSGTTQITCLTPAHAGGNYDISISKYASAPGTIVPAEMQINVTMTNATGTAGYGTPSFTYTAN